MTLLVLALVTATVAALRGMWSPCGLSMLTSLNPVSERSRGNRFGLTVAWYVGGALIGGAVLGGACAAVALGLHALAVPSTVVWALVLAAAAVAVASDSTLVPAALPDHPRQVDERWLTAYRRWIYAAGYGVQIGTGFATYIMSATVYLTAALAMLTASPVAAFTVGLAFGAVRGLGILVTAGVSSPEALRTLIARVDRLGPASLRLCAVVSGVVAAVATWTVAGPVPAGVVAVVAISLVFGRRPARRMAVAA